MANEAIAEVPPHKPKKSNVVNNYKSLSGFEGYETELGRSMSVLLKMLNNHAGYSHEMNDPLVKAHMLAIQFAKDNGTLDEYIEHDLKTMAPMNRRMKAVIDKTGHKEIALVGLFDRTACHYALALDTEGTGNSRTWSEPFGHVLKQCVKIGQFDLTTEEIHEKWTKPRLMGYAKEMGVELKVSDISEDGKITVEVVE
ncbi:MAG: hypothetical protein OEU86_08855 [Gammaproteobacteria bacterium]|nr:hypothetical protein [Gammaproteobacteria bacterium]